MAQIVVPERVSARARPPAWQKPKPNLRATWALVGLGFAFVCVWLLVASVTTCLNETPGYTGRYAAAAPAIVNVARDVLGVIGDVAPALVHSDGSCQPSLLAWLLAVASALYLVAIVLLEYVSVVRSTAVAVILGVWLISHTLLFAMPSLLSTDVFAYASYGRAAAAGDNPYVPPSTSEDDATTGGASESSDTGTSVYGPLWTQVDATIARVLPAGESDPVQVVVAYKIVASLAQFVNLALVWWLTGAWTAIGALRSPRVAAFALYAWSPIALFELSGNAHNEALMLTGVLCAFALVTLAVRRNDGLGAQLLWIGSLLALGIGALVKFVPLAVGLVFAIVWQRRIATTSRRVVLGGLVAVGLIALAVAVSWPWLDSTDILRPVLGILAGGERFRNAWQDSPADILKIKLIVPIMPDAHDSIRTDTARAVVWGFTRLIYAGIFGVVIWRLMRRELGDAATTLRTMATASAWLVLGATLLLLTQVLAWYFLWTLPMVALLGWRSLVARMAIVFGLSFFVAFYLGEMQSVGTPYLAVYAVVALALLAAAQVFWPVRRA